MASNADTAELTSFLQSAVSDGAFNALRDSVLPSLIDAVSQIAETLKHSHHVSLAGTANTFGDDQLNVDVAAENILREVISKCPSIVTASSEEDPVERGEGVSQSDQSHSSDVEQYTLAFDPLDGSSIIAPNWTVGAIIGIWTGRTTLHRSPAENQVAAILGVFGPRTTAIVALRLPGSEPVCFELGLGQSGVRDSQIVRPEVRLSQPPFKTRYFAPANLRAAAEDKRYSSLISHFIENKYTLRYSGGLVPDIVHALVKGHGVYISPVTGVSKAKLRRLYELFPIALIIECAGGKAIDPADGSDILARIAKDTDERAGLICGTAEDVDFVTKALLA